MASNIGDMVPKAGIYTEPGVIVEKKDDGTLTVDTDPLAVNKFHRYSNTTGLSQEEKLKFNEILDKVYEKANDVDKINDIQEAIDKLKVDPLNRNVVQYLRNQQAHLVRQAKNLPRVYTWDEASLRP